MNPPTMKDALLTLAEFHATFGDRAHAVADVLCQAAAALMDFQAELDDITTEAAGRPIPLPEMMQWATAAATATAAACGDPPPNITGKIAKAASEIVRGAEDGERIV